MNFSRTKVDSEVKIRSQVKKLSYVIILFFIWNILFCIAFHFNYILKLATCFILVYLYNYANPQMWSEKKRKTKKKQ